MEKKRDWSSLWRTEDWWACWFGFLLFSSFLSGLVNVVPRPQAWIDNPLSAVSGGMLIQLIVLMMGLMVMYALGIRFMGENPLRFAPGFIIMFSLGVLAQLLAKQDFIHSLGLEYVIWALVIGIIISNAIGLPKWLRRAAKTELYIKTGLVLLGAEVLFGTILNLGIQGLVLAWGVTPIVLYFIYSYGTRRLKIERTLALLIAAATSVCGVSAAIAVAAASRAKKEYLTLTISISLMATVVMSVGLPAVIKTLGIDYVVGGAWIGGTVDSTGAVVAAGELLNQQAMEVAAVIKLIQNTLIGVIAFLVALIWVTRVEKESDDLKIGVTEVWYRFPKFVIGFIALCLITSFVLIPNLGEIYVGNLLQVTKGLRSYLFSIAFISIGLETNFRELREQVSGGSPIKLYVVGQSLNIALTFVLAWLLFSGI
jgi:uncharacterized integral membrane protein (TIGR00698 family)